MNRTLTAVLHKEGDLFVADCPEVGTVSQGASIEEAIRGYPACPGTDAGYPGYPGTVYGFIGGPGVICGRHADSPFFLVCPVCRVAVCDGGDVPVS